MLRIPNAAILFLLAWTGSAAETTIIRADMETGAPAGWLEAQAAEITVALDDSTSHSGVHSFKVDSSHRGGTVTLTLDLPDRQMDAIDVQFSHSGAGAGGRLQLFYIDAAGKEYQGPGLPSVSFDKSGKWQTSSGRSTAPISMKKIGLRFNMGKTATCWIDDLQITEVELATPTERDASDAAIWEAVIQADNSFKLDHLTHSQARYLFDMMRGRRDSIATEDRRQLALNRFWSPKLKDYVFEWSRDFVRRRLEDPAFKVKQTDLAYLYVLVTTIDNTTFGRNLPKTYREAMLEPGEVMPDFYLPIIRPNMREELIAAEDFDVPQYEILRDGDFDVPWELRLFFRKQSKFRHYHDNKDRRDDILITDAHPDDPDYFHLYSLKERRKPTLLILGSFC